MEKKIQDLIWACLPKEAREEIRGRYKGWVESLSFETEIILYDDLFGHHNLTSNTEPKEMLCQARAAIMAHYSRAYQLKCDKNEKWAFAGQEIEEVLYNLFGDKCLPDKPLEEKAKEIVDTIKEDIENPIQMPETMLNPQPSVQVEPRFKIGDKVIVSHINTYFTSKVVEVNKIYPQFTYKLENLPDVWFAESLLEPYTEPETKDNTQLNSWDEDFKKMNECFEKIQKTLSSLCDTFCKLEANVNKLNRL